MQGGDYPVPKGDLAFSVIVFCVCACVCLSILTMRRYVVGGELGGSGMFKRVTAAMVASLWFIYIILASMKAYGNI